MGIVLKQTRDSSSLWEHEANTFKEVACIWNTPGQQVTQPHIRNMDMEPLMLSLLIRAHLNRCSLYQCSSTGKVLTPPRPLPSGMITSALELQNTDPKGHLCAHGFACAFLLKSCSLYEKTNAGGETPSYGKPLPL